MKLLHSPIGAWRLAAAAVLACCAAAVSAADVAIAPPTYPARFHVFDVSTARDWGFWATGRSSETPVLVRFDLEGRAAATRSLFYALAGPPVSLPDRGALVQGGCGVIRLDAQGSTIWDSIAPGAGFSCENPLTRDAAENVWLHGSCVAASCAARIDRVASLDTHGVPRVSIDAATLGMTRIGLVASSPVNAGAYVADADRVRLVRLEADGRISWTYTDASPASGARIQRVVFDPAGNLLLFGITGANAELLFASLTPSGALRFRHVLPTATSPRALSAAADATGSVVLVADATDRRDDFLGQPFVEHRGLVVHRFDASGAQRWQRSADDMEFRCLACGVRLSTQGEAILAYNAESDGSTLLTARIRSFAPDGTPLADVRTQGDRPRESGGGIWNLQILPDGSMLALTNGGGFERYGIAGGTLPAPATDDAVDAFPRHATSAFGADGSSVIVSRDENESRIVVSRFDTAGTLRWRRDIALQLSAIDARAVTNARLSCWVGFRFRIEQGNPRDASLVLECLDNTTGAVRWSQSITRASNPHLQLGDDDSLTIAFTDLTDSFADLVNQPPRVRRMRFDANGAPLDAGVWPAYQSVDASNARGDLLVSTFPGTRYAVLDRQGAVRCEFARSTGDRFAVFTLSESGRVAFSTPIPLLNDAPVELGLLSDACAVAWRKTLPAATTLSASLAFASEDVVLADTSRASPGVDAKRTIQRLAASDGRTLWQWQGDDSLYDDPSATSAPSAFDDGQLAVDPRSGTLAYATAGYPGRTRLTVLDGATGQLRRDLTAPCGNEYCGVGNLAVSASVANYVETSRFTGPQGNGPAFRVHAVAAAADAPARLDQSGIAGAWYPAYASGQGLFFDYLASSRTLFAAWFNYTPSGGNDTAALRWYTLQGDVSPGATTATLGIFENRGGVFDAPPVTNAVRVGTATLQLHGCDRATLTYAFDAGSNAGVEGQYDLTRLTAPLPCSTGNGVPLPAPVSSSGFDATQSGGWHVPATSGQGLLLSVAPGQALFAGWFTYDPASPADDPTAQHWFTLQGNLAGASGGTVELDIHRTLGGSFDRVATRNTYAIGTATLRFTACDRATLDYRFGDTGDGFAHRRGTMALEKLGGCTR